MKFVHPKTGVEYEVSIDDDTMGFASHLLDTTIGDSLCHLLRIEVFPLPCHHDLIDEMVRRMNLAALTVLQEFGAGLDLSSAEVTGEPALMPATATKH